MSVRKAVVPAAGFGTRFLPASKSEPKEMITVVDRPAIQYVVEEAARAGITDVVLVTSRGKSSMDDHFDYAPDLERHLEAAGKKEELDKVRRVAELATVHSVRQKEQLGFGHAVLMGREHVGDEPCVVLVGDEVVPEPRDGEPALVENMIELYERHHASVVCVGEVPAEDVPSYGVIAYDEIEPGVLRVTDMIEKPPIEEAPSNLASRGRYLFTPGIFDALERTEPGHGGEIQLTDAIRLLAREETVLAYVHRGPMYDVGKPLSHLQAVVEIALRHPDLAKPFREFLNQVVSGGS